MFSLSSFPLTLFHQCIKSARVSTILKRNHHHLSFTQQSLQTTPLNFAFHFVSYVQSPPDITVTLHLTSVWIFLPRNYIRTYKFPDPQSFPSWPYLLAQALICEVVSFTGFCATTSIRSFLLVTFFHLLYGYLLLQPSQILGFAILSLPPSLRIMSSLRNLTHRYRFRFPDLNLHLRLPSCASDSRHLPKRYFHFDIPQGPEAQHVK